MGGTRKSLKWPSLYDKFRRKGMSKSEAARLSNGLAKKRRNGRKRKK
jgi:hypothetical protein